MSEKDMTGISFRCTKEEMGRIEQAAKTNGCSKSEFVRNAVFQAINGKQNSSTGFPLILSPELQEHFVQGIVLSNVLTHKKMIESGEEHLFKAASKKADEVVHAMLPYGWSGKGSEEDADDD